MNSPPLSITVVIEPVVSRTLGEISAANRKLKEAEDFDRRAIEEYRKLAAEAPSVPDHRGYLAATLINLGQLQVSTNRTNESLASYQEAVEIYDGLVQSHPTNPDFLRGQARVLGNVGNLLTKRPDADATMVAYQKAIIAYEALTALPESIAADRSSLATCLSNQGDFLTQAKREGAEIAFARSIEIQSKLVAENPKNPAYRRLLAAAKINLGECLASNQRLADAERTNREGLDLLVGLTDEFPKNSTYQGDLGYVLNNLAGLAKLADRKDETRDLMERAVRADRAAIDATPQTAKVFLPQLATHLAALAEARLALGGHLSAYQAAEESVRIGGDLPNLKARKRAARLIVACMDSASADVLLSETRRGLLAGTYADRAIALLRESIERGEPNASKLMTDRAFAKLKDRDGFKSLTLSETDSPGGR